MRFRFRKIIERLEWVATIEVRYSAKPARVPRYTDESPVTSGGVKEWDWGVVSVERPINNVIAGAVADSTLRLEPDFDDQVLSWCEEDWAQRD